MLQRRSGKSESQLFALPSHRILWLVRIMKVVETHVRTSFLTAATIVIRRLAATVAFACVMLGGFSPTTAIAQEFVRQRLLVHNFEGRGSLGRRAADAVDDVVGHG